MAEASNEQETLGPVPKELNVAALLEVTEKPEELERTTSTSGEMAAKKILCQGFERAKLCAVTTSL